MKSAISIVKLFFGMILFLIAYTSLKLVQTLLIVINVLIIVVFNRRHMEERVDELAQFFYTLAYSYDQTGNALGYPFFNLTMKDWDGYRFGNPDQPISYVIAKNWVTDSLTWFGMLWAKFLIWVDCGARKRGSNHLLESIENTEKVKK